MLRTGTFLVRTFLVAPSDRTHDLSIMRQLCHGLFSACRTIRALRRLNRWTRTSPEVLRRRREGRLPDRRRRTRRSRRRWPSARSATSAASRRKSWPNTAASASPNQLPGFRIRPDPTLCPSRPTLIRDQPIRSCRITITADLTRTRSTSRTSTTRTRSTSKVFLPRRSRLSIRIGHRFRSTFTRPGLEPSAATSATSRPGRRPR